MPSVISIPPARRGDLVVRQVSDSGNCVVKDPRDGSYFDLGPEEAFLLEQLDGVRAADEICAAFSNHFGESIEPEEIDDFVGLARSRGLLRSPKEAPPLTGPCTDGCETDASKTCTEAAPVPAPAPARTWTLNRIAGKILYWRTNFFDPDRLFTWLEPRIHFVWTRGFLAVTGCMIALAVVLLVGNFSELVHLLPRAFHWETLILAWIILGVVTLLHEFAHGLTCKHYGGEVHEVGFLLMLFMPCFYCNVSDSWLFREKKKRLLVMLAGGYCDLVLWSLSVFVWRLTHAQTIVHYIACVVLSICGGRVLLNFNPLMRLDGYYLLSDWAEIPNLRKRSWDYVMAYVRHFLWGAQAPEQESRKYFLFLYGALSWCFCIVYVSLAMVGLIKLGGLRLGMVGMAIAGFLAFFILRNLVSGVGGGEFMKMLLQRHKRATVWGSILLGIPIILFAIPSEERAGGAFQIRSVTRVEVRAEVTGILKKVLIDEGNHVGKGDVIARLEIPDLDSKVKQKEAEWDEANQQLKLLAAGPRYLEIQEQEARVARAKQYFELAQKDLENARQAYQSELNKLDLQVQQYTAERDLARDQYLAERKLGGIDSRLELARYKKAYDVAQSQFDQAEATRKERAATGTQTFEAEAARRQKDLAEAESALKLLKAGTRRETIDAQQSHVDRLFEELKYMRGLANKLDITCPVENGVVMVPRYTAQSGREADGLASKLSERVGQRFNEGDLICIIEDPSDLEMDIAVDEQEAARVAAGQSADMKVRALPFSTFTGKISRVAPNAVPGEGQSIVHVYCHVENPSAELKSGMTGHARIHCGHRQLGVTLVEKVLRYLRTELWW